MNWKYITSLLVICLVIFSFWFYNKHPLSATITIGNTKFTVDLAVTPKDKLTGLSFRKVLLPQHGMLFIYENKDKYPFWMKDMNFPLDFVWIDGNKVVDITTNIPPATTDNLSVVAPVAPINKVLEINAGEVNKFNIQIGDTVTFNK
jgi:hypothetical protein